MAAESLHTHTRARAAKKLEMKLNHILTHHQTQDLEYPFQRPRVFHHQGKAPVACLRWNPHVSHQDFVASVSSAQASVLVWRVDNDYRPLMAGLRKHTRCVRT